MKQDPYITTGGNVADGKRRVYLVLSGPGTNNPQHIHLGDWTPDEILTWKPVMEKVFLHGVEHGHKDCQRVISRMKATVVAKIEEKSNDPF